MGKIPEIEAIVAVARYIPTKWELYADTALKTRGIHLSTPEIRFDGLSDGSFARREAESGYFTVDVTRLWKHEVYERFEDREVPLDISARNFNNPKKFIQFLDLSVNGPEVEEIPYPTLAEIKSVWGTPKLKDLEKTMEENKELRKINNGLISLCFYRDGLYFVSTDGYFGYNFALNSFLGLGLNAYQVGRITDIRTTGKVHDRFDTRVERALRDKYGKLEDLIKELIDFHFRLTGQ